MRVEVIGAGAWGTTTAILLARKGYEVAVWTRDAARAERAAAVRDFEAWKRASRLPEGLSADAALDFLEAARRGRDARDERERLASDRARIDRELAVWEEEARAVLEATGGADPATEGEEEGAALVEALAALRAQCEADRAARERRVPIERRRGAIAERLRASEAACESARGELAGFVEENGCRDVEELRERMGAARAARELEERARALELELDRRLDAQGQSDEGDASGGDGSGLREQLASGRTAEWEEHITAARAEIAALEEQRDELIRRQHDAANARSRLEASTEVAELELHRAALEQELREVVGEWRRLRLASGLVESTLERFERERQPNVLREASRLFARITDERYPRIVQTGERAASGKSAGFAVQGPGGALRGPETLSRGTREQLYLCLRLGLVTELERRGTSLPIVMDDVLVNFDDERATAAAALLAEFAAGHQILFFTCASRTRDLLASAGRDVDVRALGDT